MQDDAHMDLASARIMHVEHACGHLHAHLVPAPEATGGSLLLAVEMLAGHPCPACIAGAPDWAIEPTLETLDARSAGSC